MINQASVMKVMNARSKFSNNHPKFAAFFSRVVADGIAEGDVIEITVTKNNGQTPVTANMRVTREDLELIEELKALGQ